MEIADEKAPNNIERINSLAVAYLRTNQPDRSVDKMKQLIDYHPEDSGMKFDLFAKLYEHGFDEHAQKLCKETSNPLEVVRHYNNKGVALAKIGKVEEAIHEYEHSLQFYPKFKENYRIYYNIALAHLNFKTRPHFEEALNNLNKCLELNKRFEKAKRIQELVSKKLDAKKNQNTKVS
jgi:tetratricopeptide (TPR) repeat protein